MSAPQSANGNWTLLGPTTLPTNATGQPNGLGRINTVAFHPTDANTIYIGAPSGGLWRSTDGGTTWTALTANLPTLGVSSVLVHPTTPTTIFVGTGDRDAGDATENGNFYRSTNTGGSWTQITSSSGVIAGRVHPHV
jgi:hypothetical protein